MRAGAWRAAVRVVKAVRAEVGGGRRRTGAAVLAAALLVVPADARPGALGGPDAPVADAARRGDLEEVRLLLREGADVNAPMGDGMTALHWAAQRGDAEMGATLLVAGARTSAGTRIGRYTPLHLAARGGRAGMIALLVEAGADPDARTTNSGATPLHLAAASGEPAAVAALLDAGAEVDALESAWGQTPLIFAASAGRTAVVRALLAAGADPSLAARPVDVVERAAADRAANRRLSEFLAAFKEKEGGGPNWQPSPSQVQAAIEAARRIQRKWPDVPKPEDDDQRAQDSEGGEAPAATGAEADSTAAAGADSADTTDSAEAAADSVEATDSAESAADSVETTDSAESAADRVEATDSVGAADKPDTADSAESAADSASSPEDAETDLHAEPDSADDGEPRPLSYAQLVGAWGGLTPLLHAVRQGHAETVAALLDEGAEIDQPSAGDATAPLLMAAINGQFDLALELIERGADPNAASDAGTVPLFAVLERRWAPRASYSHPVEHERQRATYMDVLKALLEAGADPNVRLRRHLWYMEYTFGVLRGSGIDLGGATPFWRAAYALDMEAMRLLKEHGADPTTPTAKPPEHRRRRAAAEEEAAEESEPDPSGLPPAPVGGPAIHPIHAASGVGYGQSFAGNAHRHVPDGWTAAVRFLVEECGADVNARDANGYTPLHHAAARGDLELVLYLVGRGAEVGAVSRAGQTVADMANGPIQRQQPFPATVVLLEKLGSRNNHRCLSC